MTERRTTVETNQSQTANGPINRRNFLQKTGAMSAAGLIGVGTVDAASATERGTVTFAEAELSHDVAFPTPEAEEYSVFNVEDLAEHVVDPQQNLVSYNRFTTRATARLLASNPAAVWYDTYRALPTNAVESSRTQYAPTRLLDHPRATHGVLLAKPYLPPRFDVQTRGETVSVRVGSETVDVAPGEQVTHDLPAQELTVRAFEPSSETVAETAPGESGDASGTLDVSERTVTATPTLEVRNYGELTVVEPDDWEPREPTAKRQGGD